MSDKINSCDPATCKLPEGKQQYDWGALNAPSGKQPESEDMKRTNTNMPIPEKTSLPYKEPYEGE
jgi:hypothetical protein